ncbi:hypothetical protein ACJX0J_032533, partial [Zea mays]
GLFSIAGAVNSTEQEQIKKISFPCFNQKLGVFGISVSSDNQELHLKICSNIQSLIFVLVYPYLFSSTATVKRAHVEVDLYT